MEKEIIQVVMKKVLNHPDIKAAIEGTAKDIANDIPALFRESFRQAWDNFVEDGYMSEMFSDTFSSPKVEKWLQKAIEDKLFAK